MLLHERKASRRYKRMLSLFSLFPAFCVRMSLNSARACANSIFLSPRTQADVDLEAAALRVPSSQWPLIGGAARSNTTEHQGKHRNGDAHHSQSTRLSCSSSLVLGLPVMLLPAGKMLVCLAVLTGWNVRLPLVGGLCVSGMDEIGELAWTNCHSAK